MFSDGISSSVYCWRSNSSRIAAPTSGSTRSIRLVRSVRACSTGSLSSNQFKVRDCALAQDARLSPGQVEDGRGLTDATRPTVEHEIDAVTQAGDDLVGIDRRRRSRPV